MAVIRKNMPVQKVEPQMAKPKLNGQRGHVQPKPLSANLNEKSIVGTGHILTILGIKHSTFCDRRAAGKFPPPDINKGFNYWRVSTIQAYLAEHNLPLLEFN